MKLFFLACTLPAYIFAAQLESSKPAVLLDAREAAPNTIRRERNKVFDVDIPNVSVLDVPNIPPGAPPPPPLETIVTLWPQPELPLEKSDAVVVGHVAREQPYLTSSGKALYTEYTVKVVDTIKRPATGHEEELVILRRGGKARLANGRIIEWAVKGEGDTITVGQRYLFLLLYRAEADAYEVLNMWHADGNILRAAYPADKQRARRLESDTDGKLLGEVVKSLKDKNNQ